MAPHQTKGNDMPGKTPDKETIIAVLIGAAFALVLTSPVIYWAFTA